MEKAGETALLRFLSHTFIAALTQIHFIIWGFYITNPQNFFLEFQLQVINQLQLQASVLD